jgi:glutathione S-transferase
MLRLHDYAPSANCYKVRLLLAQLGREYVRVPVDIFGGDTLSDSFGRMNPARRTPVLEDGDGRYLPESNAILLYLADGTELLPEDPWERAQVARWMFFEQNAFEPSVGSARFWRLTGRADAAPERFEGLVQAARKALTIVDESLGDAFLAGERHTIADIALYGYGHVAGEAGVDMSEFPRFGAWVERVAATPGAIHDLVPYPDNARPGRGRSVHG